VNRTPVAYGLGAGCFLAVITAVATAWARGSPIRVGGVERTDIWAVLFLGLLALAFALYVCALVLLRSAVAGVAVVCVVAAAIQLAPLAGPLLLSRDAYSYWAYGRIVSSHDGDPYAVAPARFPHDPATGVASWRRRTSVYGPAFTLASAGVGEAAGRSPEVASFLFRSAAAVAGIATTLLAAAVARRKAYAAAFVGWNPVLAISFAGGGHNDSWMLALVLAALALTARRRDVAGGGLWIVAAAVKAPALALLLLQLTRSRRAFRVGAALAALGGAALATAAFGAAWLTSIWQLDRRETRYSLAARLEQVGLPGTVAHVLPALLLAAGAAWLALHARRGRPRLALGASLLILASPSVLPWYSTWPVALAAVDDDALGSMVALGLAAYLLPDRIPW